MTDGMLLTQVEESIPIAVGTTFGESNGTSTAVSAKFTNTDARKSATRTHVPINVVDVIG